ncbi:hypothetical protein CG723_04835 [Streptomyces sp. CB01635]|uniref:DUF6801 domain-containing protein n=1 Tax=unclassified Streptomyces TaxID=2593676 RepID=UPI000C277E57|nr:DUF6801 domain-containing protein [Streptomyces sp. CB01635]PJN12380.1 hypothetical protein CG723_04835 [Streptomyces sp. CB01635]
MTVKASHPSRLRRRAAAVAVGAMVAAAAPGAGAAPATQHVDARLDYTCRFPSGEMPVTMTVTAQLPEEARVSEEIRPSDVGTSVELPQAAVDELRTLGAASATPATGLSVGVTQGADTATTTWKGTGQPTPLPATGSLRLDTSGDVAAVSTGTPAELAFDAGELDLGLALSADQGAPANTPFLSVSCTPKSPDSGHLATVRVTDGTGTTTPDPSDTPGTTPSGSPDDDKSRDTGPRVATPRSATPREGSAPPCHKNPDAKLPLVAYITGLSNVDKLKGASLIPLSCTQADQGPQSLKVMPDGVHLIQHSTARLFNDGKEQSTVGTGTFLTFGFMPTEAKMILEQTGEMTLDSDLNATKGMGRTDIRLPLTLRLYDVRVNGTPLDVGPNCRTRGSLYSTDPDPARDTKDHVHLLGTVARQPNGAYAGYTLTTGGPLTTTLTIPPFTGCGVDEDLDALLTASISGPGNFAKQIQGQTCATDVMPRPPAECTEDRQPVVIPVPQR